MPELDSPRVLAGQVCKPESGLSARHRESRPRSGVFRSVWDGLVGLRAEPEKPVARAVLRRPRKFLRDFARHGGLANALPRKRTGPRLLDAALESPRVGLEPTTYRLTAGRSTIELTGNEFSNLPILALGLRLQEPSSAPENIEAQWACVKLPLSSERVMFDVAPLATLPSAKCDARISASRQLRAGSVRAAACLPATRAVCAACAGLFTGAYGYELGHGRAGGFGRLACLES